MSSLKDKTSAEFVERFILPMLASFTLGMLVAMIGVEHRDAAELADAQQRAAKARKVADAAINLVQTYSEACEPLLSWPIQSAPMVIPAEPSADKPHRMARRHLDLEAPQ